MKEIHHADSRCHPKLQPGEILAAVHIARMRDGAIQHFEKVGLRNALDDGGHVEQATLAWGSVGPTVVRCPETERHLICRPLRASVLSEAGDMVRRTVTPIDDVRADADYRRRVAGNLLLRLAR